MIDQSIGTPIPHEVLIGIAKSFPDEKCQEMLYVNKGFTKAATVVLTCQRIKFLEDQAKELLKQNFEPSRLENCKTLMAKAVPPELETRLSFLREAIASLYKDMHNTVWIGNYSSPFHIDGPLFLNLLQNTSDSVSWITNLNLGFSKEYILSYLALMEKNLIAPKRLYLEIEDAPFNNLFAKPIAQAVAKCSSLEEIKLHFKGWENEDLKQVLTALKENQKIHSVVFCHLAPFDYNRIGSIDNFPLDCSNLSNEMLGKDFKIENTRTLQSPALSLKRIVEPARQEL